MGYKDTIRQKLNVFRMNLLGCKVYTVKSGSQTLKDAINEAIRDWITNVKTTYYLLGSAVGGAEAQATAYQSQLIGAVSGLE